MDSVLSRYLREQQEQVDPAEGRDWVRKLDTQLRYYLHIDPDSLTDWEWAMRVNELMWIRKQEAEAAQRK